MHEQGFGVHLKAFDAGGGVLPFWRRGWEGGGGKAWGSGRKDERGDLWLLFKMNNFFFTLKKGRLRITVLRKYYFPDKV